MTYGIFLYFIPYIRICTRFSCRTFGEKTESKIDLRSMRNFGLYDLNIFIWEWTLWFPLYELLIVYEISIKKQMIFHLFFAILWVLLKGCGAVVWVRKKTM